MRSLTILFAALYLLMSCQDRYPEGVEVALELAGDNRGELERVIEHYAQDPADSLKLKAAYFLIENMSGKFFYKGELLDQYNVMFDSIGKLNYWWTKVAWDSLEKTYGLLNTADLELVSDTKVITARQLKNNIDNAFFVWNNKPWAQHLSFNNFCEFILPYRCGNEPLNDWRSELYDYYSWVDDSVIENATSVEVCTAVNNELITWFNHHDYFDRYPGGVSIKHLLQGKWGSCRDMASLAAYTMRAVGVPVAIDYTPQWGNLARGHTWNAVLKNNSKSIEFMGAESSPGTKSEYMKREKMAKAFRSTYAQQVNDLSSYTTDIFKIPPYLRSSYFIDVTNNYVQTTDISLTLRKPPVDVSYAYLGVFGRQRWHAIWGGGIDSKNEVVFKDMGRDVVYLPLYYHKRQYIPAAPPFILNKKEQVVSLKPNTFQTQSIVLHRKYPLFPRIIEFADHMIGGKFQGADNAEFKNATTFHRITDQPKQYLNQININSNEKFRYVRYIADSSHLCDIAEMRIIANERNIALEGISLVVDKNELYNAFDDIWETYVSGGFRSSAVAVDLKTPTRIDQIQYIPRTDANMIQPQDEYELFYWNNEWVSLGKQIGNKEYLVYDNVPTNALFWLRNLTKGKEERIFTYEDGKQVWW